MDEKPNGYQQYIEFKLPGGFGMRFGGRELFSIIVMTLGIGILWYIIDKHDESSSVHTKDLIQANENQVEAIEALTWVMAQDPAERKNLLLAKPKRIRELEAQRRKQQDD